MRERSALVLPFITVAVYLRGFNISLDLLWWISGSCLSSKTLSCDRVAGRVYVVRM